MYNKKKEKDDLDFLECTVFAEMRMIYFRAKKYRRDRDGCVWVLSPVNSCWFMDRWYDKIYIGTHIIVH